MFPRGPKNRLKASVARFSCDRDGGVAITFAVALVPILIGAGVAVDFARLATKHTSLQQATDSAALAIAQNATASTTSADVLAQAQNYITTNYSNRTAAITSASMSSDHTSVCVSAQDSVPPRLSRRRHVHPFRAASAATRSRSCSTIQGR